MQSPPSPIHPGPVNADRVRIDCAMQLAHEKKVKLAECDRLDTVRKDRRAKSG